MGGQNSDWSVGIEIKIDCQGRDGRVNCRSKGFICVSKYGSCGRVGSGRETIRMSGIGLAMKGEGLALKVVIVVQKRDRVS